MHNSEIDMLYQRASELSENDQLQLISKLANSLQKTRSLQKRKLAELQGLGKKIWHDIDADNYVKCLREEWDE